MLTSGIGNNENHWIWTFNFWVMSFFPKGHKYLVFFSNGSLHSKHFLLLLHWEYLSSIVHPTWIPRLLKGRKWTVFGGKRIHSMLFCWLFVDYEIAIDCSTHGSLVDLGRDGAHNREPGASLELFYSGMWESLIKLFGMCAVTVFPVMRSVAVQIHWRPCYVGRDVSSSRLWSQQSIDIMPRSM